MKVNIFVLRVASASVFLLSLSTASNPKPDLPEGSSARAKAPSLLRAAAAAVGDVNEVHASLQESVALASPTRKALCYPTVLTHDNLSAILMPREDEMNWAGPKRVLKVKIQTMIEDRPVTLYCSPKTSSDTLLLLKLYNANKANSKVVGVFDKTILSGQGAHTMAQTQDTYAVAAYYFYSYARQQDLDGAIVQDNVVTVAHEIEMDQKKEFRKIYKYTPLLGQDQPPLYFVFASNAAELPDIPILEEKRKSGPRAESHSDVDLPIYLEPNASDPAKAKSSSPRHKKEKKKKDKKGHKN